MRISNSAPQSPAPHSRSHQASRTPLLVFSLIAAFALGFLTHQYRWYELPLRWGTALTTWRARAGLPVVALEVRFSDYQRLDALQARALRLGAHIPFEEESVPAVLIFDAGGRESVTVRLPGGPALPGEAWVLEVRRAEAAAWLRLTPLDTAHRASAWLQWGYLEALRREGFAAATLTPVRLEVNGTSRGLYLLETPAPVAMAARFDAQAAWEALVAGERTDSGFRYAAATGDPAASALLRAVLAGEIALADVCDAERMGRFLALTALWTGQPVPDWPTLRWAYDPVTQQLAPVGAVQPARLSLPQAWDDPTPLPQAFLDDPAVQAATARALAEFSRPAYLEHIRAELGPALEAQWQALGLDAADTPWTHLEAHQQAMRARLTSEHALAATLEQDDAALILHLANRQPFPIHIVGLDAGGAGLRALDPAWVLAADRARLVEAEGALVLRAAVDAVARPARVHLPREMAAAGGEDLSLVYRLWGMDGPLLRVPVKEPAQLFEATP